MLDAGCEEISYLPCLDGWMDRWIWYFKFPSHHIPSHRIPCLRLLAAEYPPLSSVRFFFSSPPRRSRGGWVGGVAYGIRINLLLGSTFTVVVVVVVSFVLLAGYMVNTIWTDPADWSGVEDIIGWMHRWMAGHQWMNQ